MEKIIQIPEKVNAEVEKFKVSISSGKDKLERDFSSPLFRSYIKIEKVDNTIIVSTKALDKKMKAEVGTIAAHIKNMIDGVTKGYTYRLKIVYMHFPVTVKVSGKDILINNFLGEKKPRKAPIIGDTKVEVAGDEITVTGVDLEKVSQTAANIETATKIKARDRRVFQDGCFITEKP